MNIQNSRHRKNNNGKDMQGNAPERPELARELVKIARQMVERDGYNMISLRGVARASGISQAAPYHYFKDKSDLLATVAAEGFREKAAMMRQYAEDANNPRDRLNRIGQAYIRFAADHPLLFALMQEPSIYSGMSDELAEAIGQNSQILDETVMACLPGANAKQIMSACAGAWSIVHGMAVLYIDGRLGRMIDLSDIEKASKVITGRLALERFLEI